MVVKMTNSTTNPALLVFKMCISVFLLLIMAFGVILVCSAIWGILTGFAGV